MALTKTVVVDKIEVLEMAQVQVRTATVVAEDGVELSRSFHRHVLEPGDDLTGQDDRVAAVAAAAWTPDVIAHWDAIRAERQAEMDASLVE
jgi:urease accessory protein UreE|tara:strand:+ start:4453 stop:4725 length:273 start_codon:yes stop_codon:yes gene_type:complete